MSGLCPALFILSPSSCILAVIGLPLDPHIVFEPFPRAARVAE
jgi:hypothetical protein